METTKEAGGHFGIDLPTQTSKHVTTLHHNEQELKCHRYLVFLWLFVRLFNPSNTELNPICHLLSLLGAAIFSMLAG
jgi:hypothetical protein